MTTKLKCAWCKRPQPYGPESTTESGKNICYECSYESELRGEAFTKDGKTYYRDLVGAVRVKMVKAPYRIVRRKSEGGAWGYAVVNSRGKEVYWDDSRYEAQIHAKDLNDKLTEQ